MNGNGEGGGTQRKRWPNPVALPGGAISKRWKDRPGQALVNSSLEVRACPKRLWLGTSGKVELENLERKAELSAAAYDE